ncbi:MAG TPA: SGNH/GDSL hydrolase family protein [Allosphingosinicella sp.]|jgi:Ca2+-binding RTX toxin-like protein
MGYSGVFVFGDSLVDAGNALKLAEFAEDISLAELPAGVPTSEKGYYEGRFTDGLTFADLVSNKFISMPTTTVFPFGFTDPWIGVSFRFVSDPEGNNLNFAYGGAQIRKGEEVVPDLDDQTDAFIDAVDGDADPNALHMVTMGGNDVRRLVPDDAPVADAATARTILADAAQEMHEEVGDLIRAGVRHVVVTGIPDVGMIPEYNGLADEAARRAAATEYSAILDGMIQDYLGQLRVQYPAATIHYVSLTDATTKIVDNLDRIFAPEDLAGLHNPSDVLFFDFVHPTAQAHTLLASAVLDSMSGAPAGERYALTAPDYRVAGNIGQVGEVDTITLSLAANTRYTFELLGLSSGSGSLADPRLQLLGPGNVVFGGDDDGGLGLDASLQFTTGQAGDYVVQMGGVGSLSGGYSFQASGPFQIVHNGTQADDRLVGTNVADRIRGLGGNDLLDGGAGADVMEGGAGNDTYLIDNAGDQVVETSRGGTDHVLASASHRMGAWVETLTLADGALSGTGNSIDNVIVGNAAANSLNGGRGADRLEGGAGNDRYAVDQAGDVVVEAADGGRDVVSSAVSYSLGDNVEDLVLTGAGHTAGTGNSLGNRMSGNGGGNVLKGEAGGDTLRGMDGADDLYGGDANDVLEGGAGADRFHFDAALNARSNVDRILDFSSADDTIMLDTAIFGNVPESGALSEAAFRQGNAARDADDRIVYNEATGNLYYDADGAGGAAMVLFARVAAGTTLDHLDFAAGL